MSSGGREIHLALGQCRLLLHLPQRVLELAGFSLGVCSCGGLLVGSFNRSLRGAARRCEACGVTGAFILRDLCTAMLCVKGGGGAERGGSSPAVGSEVSPPGPRSRHSSLAPPPPASPQLRAPRPAPLAARPASPAMNHTPSHITGGRERVRGEDLRATQTCHLLLRVCKLPLDLLSVLRGVGERELL